jgi:hypothetical protein
MGYGIIFVFLIAHLLVTQGAGGNQDAGDSIRAHVRRLVTFCFLSFKIVLLCIIELLVFPVICGVVSFLDRLMSNSFLLTAASAIF